MTHAPAYPDLRIQQRGAERTRAHHSLSARFPFAALPADQAMFRSASLAAYVAVSRRKGYRLVGINALGFNAIFLRDDVLATEMPEIPVSVLDANPASQEDTRAMVAAAGAAALGTRCRQMDSSDTMPHASAPLPRRRLRSILRSAIVVCIPCFRRPQHLRLTLESLADQRTDRRFAVVIVENDASACGSVPVATEFLAGRQISRPLRGRTAAGQLPRHQRGVRDRAGDVSGRRQFPDDRRRRDCLSRTGWS